MTISKELFRIANSLTDYADYKTTEMEPLEEVAEKIGKSWSSSWLGYHSKVYYIDFQIPPPGAVFSQQWGLRESYTDSGSRGKWREYNFDEVINQIYQRAGNPSTNKIFVDGAQAKELFDEAKSSVLSLVYSNYDPDKDRFLKGLADKIESSKVSTETDYIDYVRPKGQFMSTDLVAIEKGLITPPHIAVLANIFAAKQPFHSCRNLKKNILKLASYIQNRENRDIKEERIGTNIFIGHGRSPFWRELKDFVNDRLELPWDEFNRVPVAGITNITRLAQMLDQACIAFLIMTAEDEQADGNFQARMNVIHEVGLFQGRLGFERAIVLLEEGCQEFSNIQGLGQIRFPKSNISAIFEDIRQVLEREHIIDT